MSSIQVTDRTGVQTVDPGFAAQVREMSGGESFDRCYQCFTCSLGCPVAVDMDYHPDRIMRMIQLGLKDQVLTSKTIWTCLGCETCVARCPNEIDILRVMDTLREIAIREKVVGKDKNGPVFHKTFLDPINWFGKAYELGLILLLKLRTKDYFTDLDLGVRMLIRNKLPFFPSRIKGVQQIRRIFKKTSA